MTLSKLLPLPCWELRNMGLVAFFCWVGVLDLGAMLSLQCWDLSGSVSSFPHSWAPVWPQMEILSCSGALLS